MFRRGRIFVVVVVGLFFTLFFIVQPAFAYDHTVAHPNIAALAGELYNSQNNFQLNEEQIKNIIRGAQEEDMPLRWFNHFFDPVYNVGFSDFGFSGVLPAFSSAPIWLQSPYEQIKYSIGDRSWKRALDDYARGDEENAFVALGHAIHLLSDMAVPAHTRDSAHPGDSYESFVKNNWNEITPLLSFQFKEINNLEQTFEDLAQYSNNNFYSDRTIESEKYNFIKIDYFKKTENNKAVFINKTNLNKEIYLYVGNIYSWDEGKEIEKKSNIINLNNSTILIPQAVGYSAGLVKYFLQEAEIKKEALGYNQLSWWNKIKSALFDSSLPTVRQNTEGYIMEKTIAPSVEFGGDVLEKIKETKENIQELAKQSQESESEEFIPEAKAKENIEKDNFLPDILEVVSSTEFTTITEDTENSDEYPIFRSSPLGENNLPLEEQPIADTYTEAPELFLELFQSSTNTVITLTFNSTETTSLPVSFEGEINTGTLWTALFPWTTSTSYIYETNNSGDYEFRVRAVDFVNNTSTWAQIVTTVPRMDFTYNYLTGDQVEDLVILTKAGSPYVLDYYNVPVGKTLRIEAGVIVKSLEYEDEGIIYAYGNLDIGGSLEIQGSSSDKVIFTTVYDHSFGDDFLNTVSLSTSSPGDVIGGILIRNFSGNVQINNFETRQFERLQHYIELASLIEHTELEYVHLYNECFKAQDATTIISNAKFIGCGGEGALVLQNSQTTLTDVEISSNFNSYDNGIIVEGGRATLNKVKMSGFESYPLKVFSDGVLEFGDLIFENNRVNGIYDEGLTGDLILKKGDTSRVLDERVIHYLDSFTVEPGAEFYYEGKNGISSNEDITLIGTEEDRIKIYLPDIYDRMMSFNNTTGFFKYVDFVGGDPYLNEGLKASYNIESPWDLMLADNYRAEILDLSKNRSSGLAVRNGSVTLEKVRFFSSFIPWESALYLYNSDAILKDVEFINLKPYGDLFYLDETQSKGINGEGGTVDLDNNIFSDLDYGIYSDTGYYYGLISVTSTNMSSSSFVNVLNISSPEGLFGI